MVNGALPHGPSCRAHPRLYPRVSSPRRINSVAIGGIADMPRTPAARPPDAHDPEQTIGHHAASIRAPHLKKMATWTDHAPTTEPQRRPIGIVCEPRREQMRMKATLSLAIGLCVACVAILIALHVLEPEFNPPHLISEYQ